MAKRTVRAKTPAAEQLRQWWSLLPREEQPGERWGGLEVAQALSWTDEDGRLHEVLPGNLQHIKDLPPIVQHIAAGKLWLAPEIREFAKVYQARQRARHAKRAA